MERGVTWKAFLIGGVLSLLLSFIEPYGIHIIGGSPLCADFSTGGALLLFFILIFIVNAVWKLLHRKSSLNPKELIIVYIMMIVACSIISWGFVLNLLSILAGFQYYASPVNKWGELILPHIPKWLLPQGSEVVRAFYEGLAPGTPIPWSAWIRPLFFWSLFILAAYFLMIAVMVVFRKTWIEEERILFPLTQLPLAMSQEENKSFFPPLFKNPLFWIGFAIPFLIYSLKALHSYFPFFPEIQLHKGFSIFRHTTYIHLNIMFEVIGLTYLITTDLSLGIWLFTLYAITLTGYLNMIGWSIGSIEPFSDPSIPTVAHQVVGALIALSFYVLWRSRSHIKNVLKKALGIDRNIDDSEEILSYRTVFFGGLASIVFMLFFLVKMGVPLFAALFFLGIAYIIFVGLTRAVAQGGVAYGRPPVAPFFMTTDWLGTKSLGASGIVGLGVNSSSWAADTRTFVMASVANALKMVHEKKIKEKKLVFWVIVGAILLTLLGTYTSGLLLAYRNGALNTYGWHYKGLPQFMGKTIRELIIFPHGIEWKKIFFEGVGAALMLALIWLRNNFLWWPIHPLGLAIGSTSPSQWVWFSIFLGWLLKVIILRYGGVKIYKQLLPLFYGFILGGFVAAGVWLGIDALTGMTGNIFTLG
ncbi:MAG: hypothetical protein GXO71_06240 [Caldiserica bacterium]|nr:hypothetical protein [Caldisericota bacterium]